MNRFLLHLVTFPYADSVTVSSKFTPLLGAGTFLLILVAKCLPVAETLKCETMIDLKGLLHLLKSYSVV